MTSFSPFQIFLALAGTAAGIGYSLLGLAALRHLKGAKETDRTVGWTLWWFADYKRYNTEGQFLCRRGGVLFALGAVCWVGVYLLGRV